MHGVSSWPGTGGRSGQPGLGIIESGSGSSSSGHPDKQQTVRVLVANADRVEAQCPTTSILPGGQITTQGTIVNRSLNFTLPITGDSGQFQGAGGQVVSRDVSTPTQPQSS